jgi:sensor histidine kinase YesM
MVSPDKIKPLGPRLPWLFGLNVSIGILMAITLWWFQSSGDARLLPARLGASLIHSVAYGGMFGLAMPYLGERLVALRFPWNWSWIVASLALIAAASTLVVQLCLLTFNLLSAERFWPEFCYKALAVLFIAMVIAICVQAYDNFREQIQETNLQLRTQQLEKERALKLATEARLTLLESRLHPHFLFNTLNSISALISEDPALAEQMIQRLAALLRASLGACAKNSIPLKEELNLVKDYIEIEKARFRERLSFSIDETTELESLPVPPMMLQPLVENSIKYTIAPRLRGGEIRVSVSKRAGQLVLSVWDDGAGFSLDAIPAGHSLDNLRSRLITLLGDTASLSVCRQDMGTMVTLYLPLAGFDAT